MVEPQEDGAGKINSISFNQDQGCFACSTGEGFRIYNTYPFKETFQRALGGGIGLVSMLYRSNILALVGGGEHAKFPPNKVMIWDDHQMKGIGELSFKSNVKSVRLRKERIVVALDQRIYIYQISDLKLLDAQDTFANPEGLCALSPKDATILVCPDKKKGYIRITNYDNNTSVEKKAHDSTLSAIAISMDGKLCATASDKGTLIRVFATEDGKLLQELRRGADKADIHCIAFDKTSHWLACTSDKGTVHVFSLAAACKATFKAAPAPDSPGAKPPAAGAPGSGEVKNPTSVFKFMKGIFSYFSSEWSFAQFRIPDSHSVVAFGPEDQNVIIGTRLSSPPSRLL
jgi:WD40 repeat protein